MKSATAFRIDGSNNNSYSLTAAAPNLNSGNLELKLTVNQLENPNGTNENPDRR
jgi:hypothetical protein